MRQLIITLLMFCSATIAMADNVWCMITPSGQVIPMGNVAYLVSAGGTSPETFDIVLKQGDPVTTGRIDFVQLDPTGIEIVRPSGDVPTLSSVMGDQLVISGTAAGQQVVVYSLTGAVLLRTVTADTQTTLNIGNLTSGVYVLKVGGTAIKFMKK